MPPRTPDDLDAPLTRDQLLVTAGIMAAIAVAALDSTVVGPRVTYVLMFVAAALACLLAIRTMPDVSLGHELAAGAGGRAD